MFTYTNVKGGGTIEFKKKSLKSTFKFIFILFIVMAIIESVFSFVMNKKISEQYEKNADIEIKLSEIPIFVNNSYQYIDFYEKTKDVKYFDEFNMCVSSISDIIEFTGKDINKDEDSSIYLRNLENMLDYYKVMVNKLMLNDNNLPESYSELTEIKSLVIYMDKHAQNLSIAFSKSNAVKYSQLLKVYKSNQRKIFAVNFIILFIGMEIVGVYFNKVMKTIESLSKASKNLAMGNMDIGDIGESEFRELNYVARAFNNMKNEIKIYIDKIKEKSELEKRLNEEKLANFEKDKLLRESQLKTLQMQMNPHFLFNILNTMSRLAMFEGADKTEEVILAASKILRYNLDNRNNHLVQMEEELETLNSYMFIQKIRFDEEINFDLKIHGDINNIYIPPMTIQPIVENSVIHGLRKVERKGKVYINIERAKDHVNIYVQDNGVGIEKDKLNNIFEENVKVNEATGHTTSLGLYNVKRRLELYFGEKNLINIKSEENKGTTVEIIIPIVEVK